MANEELTLRQTEFLRHYLDPQSETFGNALQSALKAGYSQEYSRNMIGQLPEWLSANISRRKRLLEKAERALEEMLDMPTEVIKWERTGYEDGDPQFEDVVKTDPGLVRIKQDTAKFIAKTQGKNDGYSERIEHTGKDGNPIATTLSKADLEAIDDLKQVLGSDD